MPAQEESELGYEVAPPDWPGWVDEGCLLESLRSGAEAAYEALLERFQTPVYHLVQRLIDDPNEAPHLVGGIAHQHRFGDLASAIAFFGSDDAGFITGQVISVSGGLTMHG